VAPVDSPVRRASRVAVEGRRSATGRVAPRQHGRISHRFGERTDLNREPQADGQRRCSRDECSRRAVRASHTPGEPAPPLWQRGHRFDGGSKALSLWPAAGSRFQARAGSRRRHLVPRHLAPVPMVTRSSNWAVIAAVRRLFRDRDGLRPGGRCVISSRPLRPLPWRRRRCRRRAPRPLGSVRVLPDRPGSA
jgi:hypothetical protein